MVILRETKDQHFKPGTAKGELQKGQEECQGHAPALLSLQQLAVGGDLNVESHLHVEQVLVLSQVTSHVVLQINTSKVLLQKVKWENSCEMERRGIVPEIPNSSGIFFLTIKSAVTLENPTSEVIMERVISFTRTIYLHLGNVRLQPGDGILVARSIAAHAVLHVSHLAQQRLILRGGADMKSTGLECER